VDSHKTWLRDLAANTSIVIYQTIVFIDASVSQRIEQRFANVIEVSSSSVWRVSLYPDLKPLRQRLSVSNELSQCCYDSLTKDLAFFLNEDRACSCSSVVVVD
jgi:hypothetical protein